MGAPQREEERDGSAPERGGEGWERGLSTGRRVPGVVFAFGFGREGKGLRDCCFYTQLNKLESRGSLWFAGSSVTQPVAGLRLGPRL